MLKLGDEVKWKSQAGGFWKEKLGVIVEVVPPGKKPGHAIQGGVGLMGRLHESYVVELVEITSARYLGTKLKPKFLWPVASKLTKINK